MKRFDRFIIFNNEIRHILHRKRKVCMDNIGGILQEIDYIYIGAKR